MTAADLAAAVQTIIEAGFDDLQRAVADAFDGAAVSVAVRDGLFDLQLHQRGMLRPLRAAELSDGTLRFLLWAAALLSPQPPSLMVLNEPETSLHPDLVRPLGVPDRRPPRTGHRSSSSLTRGRCWNFSAPRPSPTPSEDGACGVPLYKELGETRIEGVGMLTTPPWDWGSAEPQRRFRPGRSARLNTTLACRIATL